MTGCNVGRRTRSSEEGVSLVELMFALVLLGLVLAGVVAGAIAALRITQVNEQRAVASNIAQEEIERTRALPFETLQSLLGQTERVATMEAHDYRVVREISWSGLDSATDVCVEGADSVDAAVLRVEVFVSPVDAPDVESSSTTAIARPPVNPADDVGALSVRVTDHQLPAQPVSSVLVTVTGPGGSGLTLPTQVTPSTGCVLFLDLEVGNYDVRIERAGYVGPVPGANESQPTTSAGVSAGERTAVEFSYAPSAALTLEPVSLDGDPDVVGPNELQVTISRDGRVRTSDLGAQMSPLWPGTWNRWSGDCPEADPLGVAEDGTPFWPGAQRQEPAVLDPVHPLESTVDLAPVWLELPESGEPFNVSATAVSVFQDPDPDDPDAGYPAGCEGGTGDLTFPGTFDAETTAKLGLPYGRWLLTISSGIYQNDILVEVDPSRDWTVDGPLVVGPTEPPEPAEQIHVLDEPGAYSWVVPDDVTEITVHAWGGGGAGGGGGSGRSGGDGGGAGYSTAVLPVTPGEDLVFYVGGGGSAGLFDSGGNAAGSGGGGGGLTAVFRDGAPVFVAPGGGGGGGGDNQTGSTPSGGAGGPGGGSPGLPGGNAGPNGNSSVRGGGPGTATEGGAGGSSGSDSGTYGTAGIALSGGAGGDASSEGVAGGDGGTIGGAPGGRGDGGIGRPGGGGGGAGYWGGGGGQAANAGNTSGAGGGGGSALLAGTGQNTLPGLGISPGGIGEVTVYDGVAGFGGQGGATGADGEPGRDGLLVVIL